MSFVSDHAAFRTFDPESGRELLEISSSRGQTFHFQLAHPKGVAFRFGADLQSVTDTGENGEDGKPLAIKTWRVFYLVDPPPPLTRDEQEALIHDALHGFGVIHNGPSGSTNVSFVR